MKLEKVGGARKEKSMEVVKEGRKGGGKEMMEEVKGGRKK